MTLGLRPGRSAMDDSYQTPESGSCRTGGGSGSVGLPPATHPISVGRSSIGSDSGPRVRSLSFSNILDLRVFSCGNARARGQATPAGPRASGASPKRAPPRGGEVAAADLFRLPHEPPVPASARPVAVGDTYRPQSASLASCPWPVSPATCSVPAIRSCHGTSGITRRKLRQRRAARYEIGLKSSKQI